MKVIDSPNNEWIKELSRLSIKKYRDTSDVILVEGEHLVEEARNAGYLEMVLSTTSPCDVLISETVAKKLSLTQSGSSIFGIVRKPQSLLPDTVTRLMICDGVQDPGNTGTIIRTAHSFGFDGVLLTQDSADPLNDKTIRSSQGALFHIPVLRMNHEMVLKVVEEKQLMLAVTDVVKAQRLSELDKDKGYAIVIGSEGQGVSMMLRDNSDVAIKIETSQFESLNAAVAASIIAYVLRK